MAPDTRDPAEIERALRAMRSDAGSGVPDAAFKLGVSLIAQG